MTLLLDTHIVLWWFAGNPTLSEASRSYIADNRNIVMVSAATVWEIAIKSSIGKLEIDDHWIDALKADGFQQLPISWNHAERVRKLSPIHKDPFDRLLVAQAIEEKLTIITADPVVPTYPVETIVN